MGERKDGIVADRDLEAMQAVCSALGKLPRERVAPVLAAALHLCDCPLIANAVLGAGKATPR